MRSMAVALILVLALLTGGCSKCDPWWGDKPAACHGAVPAR